MGGRVVGLGSIRIGCWVAGDDGVTRIWVV
jgi:hypothetical protein